MGTQSTHLAYKRALKILLYILKHTRVCLCLFTLPLLSLSIFVSRRHTLPASQWEAAAGRSPEWYRDTLGDDHPVIIYLHGNVGTRWDECSTIETLELILMESSGYYMAALAPAFIHRYNTCEGLL